MELAVMDYWSSGKGIKEYMVYDKELGNHSPRTLVSPNQLQRLLKAKNVRAIGASMLEWVFFSKK